MLDRKKRLNEVYEHLRKYHGIHTKGGFADAIKYARAYISSALNGNEKYLTDKLFENICEIYPGVFNLDYLLTGKGSLLAEETAHNDAFLRSMEAIDPSSFINAIIAAKDETIATIREQLETKDELILSLRQQLESLRQQLETTRHHSGSGIEQSIPMVADELQKTKK